MIALASVLRFHLHAKDAPLRRVDDKSEGVRKRAGLLDRWGGKQSTVGIQLKIWWSAISTRLVLDLGLLGLVVVE